MHPIAWQGIAWGGLFALNRLLDWAQKPRTRNTPPAPQRFEVARADDGTLLPIVYGRYRVDSPALVWFGNNQNPVAIANGYTFHIDMLFVVGIPQAIDLIGGTSNVGGAKITKIWWGDLEFKFTAGSFGHGVDRRIDEPNAFGGKNAGGGFGARVQFFDGRASQNLSGSLITQRMIAAGVPSDKIPNYRYQMVAGVFTTVTGSGLDFGIGESPRLPQISFEVAKTYGSNLPDGANPALVIYDLLVGKPWKLGYAAADVDSASFNAARETLDTEGHDYSNVFYQDDDARQIILEICEQIDARLYEDPTTSKLVLKLIRADWDPGDCLEMTHDNTNERPGVQESLPEELVNEVVVQFSDRKKGYKQNSARAHDEANLASNNFRRNSVTIHYPGCCTMALATRLAGREVNKLSRPSMVMQVMVNRTFFATRPGDVVKSNWPRWPQLSGKFFRVQQVDLGQLADGTIRLHLIEEVFGLEVGGFPGDPGPDGVAITLPPLTERVLTESPYLLQYFAFNKGQVANLTDQRILSLAVAEGLAHALQTPTTSGGTTGLLGPSSPGADIGIPAFPITCTIAIAYPATLAPYDTTTGLVVENLVGETSAQFTARGADYSDVLYGANLALVVSADGAHEIIAFEGVTALGGGQYRLGNVWRELLDTVPVDHEVGERVYLIDTRYVGRRAWPADFYVRGFAIPSYKNTLGSEGINASDDIVIRGRVALPPRAADIRASGYDLEGTRGLPAVVATAPYLGGFKVVSRLDGALDLAGRERVRTAAGAIRGDDPTSYTAEAGTTWDVLAQKLGDEGGDEVEIRGHTGLSSPSSTGILLGQAGHGTLRVKLRTQNGGRASWQDAAIDVTAAPYRNLLAFGSCENGLIGPAWSNVVGTAQFGAGTFSLPRTATGRWFVFATAVAGVTTIRQEVDVTGYAAGGLSALVTFYARNAAGDTDDYATAAITALDAAGAPIGATTTSSNIVGPLTHWRRAEVSKTLPNGTVKVRVDITMRGGTGDDTVPNVGVTGIGLQLGQMSAQLLSNPSFDDELADWDDLDDSFEFTSTAPYASTGGTFAYAAQGGDFATSSIGQTPAIPAGFEYGVAYLTFARSTTVSGDTGEVVIEALSSGGSVLASATTGPTSSSTLSIWDRGRLALQLPDAAVSLRVRLLATRAGSGPSGACFDDFSLRIHKDLDARHRYDFDFRAPAWVPAPATWQRFHLAYPTQPVPAMVWGGLLAEPSIQPSERLDGPTHAWSGAAPGAAKFTGYWDVGPHPLFVEPTLRYAPVTDAYQFTRAAAGAAVDLQTSGADADGEEYGAFSLDEPFAIAIQYRIDEPVFGGACGLVGRRGVSGIGWGLLLNGSGQPVAVLQGTAGTASATASNATTDRAPHWAILSNDGAGTLTLYDDFGGTTTASTAGLGSIDVAGAPLRIGRDGPASAVGGVQIARVLLWRVALSGAEAAAIMEYGGDPSPSTLLGTWTSNQAVWVPGPDDGIDGATLVRFAAGHVPIGYAGGGYGLALAGANTNKIPTHDLTNTTHWLAETGVTLTHGVVDPTGLPRGVHVANAGANQNLRCAGITMGVGTPLSVVLWARTTDGVARTLEVELLDSAAASIAAATVALTEDWQRFVVQIGPWAAPTATAILRFGLASTAVGTFELGHVIWAGFGTEVPWAIQDAGLAISDTFGSKLVSLPRQLNREGELYVECLGPVATPSAGKTLASVDNDTNTNGERALATAASGVPRFTLRNATGTAANSDGTALDWSQDWTLRGRWNRLELPESLGEQQGIVVEGSADSAIYAANAFTVLTSGLAAIRIGGGGFSGGSPHALIRRVIVRAREPKLAGS